MKSILITLSFIVFFISMKAQVAPAEKLAMQLDSISKADNIKEVCVFFHYVSNNAFSDLSTGCTKDFRFSGQMLILNSSEKTVLYYNLNKLIHFNLSKKQKRIDLFLQGV